MNIREEAAKLLRRAADIMRRSGLARGIRRLYQADGLRSFCLLGAIDEARGQAIFVHPSSTSPEGVAYKAAADLVRPKITSPFYDTYNGTKISSDTLFDSTVLAGWSNMRAKDANEVADLLMSAASELEKE